MTRVSDAEMTQILKQTKSIAVIGLSPVPARPSYGVTRYMISHGYKIFGVRPASPPEILGRPAYEKIADLKEPVDLLNVFRNPEALPDLVTEIEGWMKTLPDGQRPKFIWFQEGVTNAEAEAHARKLGLQVVADKCILKEHARLM